MANTRNIGEDGPAGSIKWRLPLALLLVAAVTAAVYWPTLHNSFIDYDDPDYVTSNMAVLQGLSLKGFFWAFTAFHAGNWHPLTWLSHMLDIQLFGLNPLGHHLTSLLLHTVNALLLCAVLCRLTGFLGRSVVVALLFALHPLHVESVAWIAERKDLLSTLFWLLTMAAYCGYVRKPGVKRYLPVAVLFALGLMAKQMLVTLPLVLLLADFWPLTRVSGQGKGGFTPLLAEKIPLVVMAAGAALITLRSQASAGALSHTDGHSALLFAGNALISYVKYIGMMFRPAGLALFYPFEPSSVTPLRVTGAAALLAGITVAVIIKRKTAPYLAFGWCWYLVTLLPVIGFVRVGSQAMANRYTYIPLTGLFLMLVWGAAEIAGRWRYGLQVAGGAAVAVLAALSVLTVRQIGFWENSYVLYSRALQVVERNWLAHNNLGILLAQQYRNDEAILHFREALRINPALSDVYRNLGNAYLSTGNTTAALEAFREALRINPDDREAHFRLGYAWLMNGNSDLAYREYQELQRLNDPRAQSLLDSIRMRGGR